MRKLINSAFLLLLTLFIVGKSWADCPTRSCCNGFPVWSVEDIRQENFVTKNIGNGQSADINNGWYGYNGVALGHGGYALSMAIIELTCDDTIRNDARSLYAYKCDYKNGGTNPHMTYFKAIGSGHGEFAYKIPLVYSITNMLNNDPKGGKITPIYMVNDTLVNELPVGNTAIIDIFYHEIVTLIPKISKT